MGENSQCLPAKDGLYQPYLPVSVRAPDPNCGSHPGYKPPPEMISLSPVPMTDPQDQKERDHTIYHLPRAFMSSLRSLALALTWLHFRWALDGSFWERPALATPKCLLRKTILNWKSENTSYSFYGPLLISRMVRFGMPNLSVYGGGVLCRELFKTEGWGSWDERPTDS